MSQCQLNIDGINTINVPYTIVEQDAYESQLIKQESILDGSRRWVNPFFHAEFNMLVLLWKYDDPNTQLSTLLSYVMETTKLKPNDFYGWISDATGNATDFIITEVIPFNTLPGNNKFDYALIKLFSVDYANYYPSILRRENYPDGTDGSPIITDDDKFIILDY